MAITDTTRKAENIGSGVPSINVTINSTVAGNLLVAFGSTYRNGTGTPATTCGDGGNTWSTLKSQVRTNGAEKQEAHIQYSSIASGGNRTVTYSPNAGGNCDMWGSVHEFSGHDSGSPVSGTPVGNSGTSETTADTTGFTPADADCLYVACEGNSATGAVTENASPGDTDWTFDNDHESGATGEPGGSVFFIRSGSAVSRRAAWTITSGTFWAAVIGAFKPSTASPVIDDYGVSFVPIRQSQLVPIGR